MRMTRERKNMKKKKPVGLIVERTFRDSSQPLALLKTFPFTRRPINLNRPNFPSPSPTLRTFDKTYGSSVLSMGLSFDERPDETLTGEKYVWHLVENHFSTLDNGNADPQSKEKPTDIERRFQKKKEEKKYKVEDQKTLKNRLDAHSPTTRFDFFISSTGNRGLIKFRNWMIACRICSHFWTSTSTALLLLLLFPSGDSRRNLSFLTGSKNTPASLILAFH